MKTENDYDVNAQKFLDNSEVQMNVKLLRVASMDWDSPETKRDIYQISLARDKNRFYVFEFGQSLNASGKFISAKTGEKSHKRKPYDKINKDFKEPNAYDVLACLQKYETDSYTDFCDEFGFDEDSKSLTTYEKVKNEVLHVKILWSDEEIELLREIQ